jgi:hypothetical protein
MMALRMRPEKFIEKYGHPMDGWRIVSPNQRREPGREQRPLFNEVPMKRHSSGKEGSKLTADRLFPASKPKPYAQTHAETVARQDISPLGGQARVSKGREAAWKAQARKLKALDE